MASVFSEAGGWFYFWPSPFVKVGFLDKVTGLWAFEGHLPFQKYQGPPIVVRSEHFYWDWRGYEIQKIQMQLCKKLFTIVLNLAKNLLAKNKTKRQRPKEN